MKFKEACKIIDKMVESLPSNTYEVVHKYEPWTHTNDEGSPLIGYSQKHTVNHKRRMQRIWKKTKNFTEVQKYIQNILNE